MSSYYGLIVSEYRHYDYEKQNDKSHTKLLPTANTILSQYDSSPPSYSAVLAEKYFQQQHCATWDQKLSEINSMLRAMKQSIHETQIMMKSFQYCCQKLKFKNQSLLTELQQKMVSFSEMNSEDTLTYNNNTSYSETLYQKKVNDSLTRMNLSLEKLIEEAEISLNTRLSLHADPHPLRRSRSCPRFTIKRNEFKRRNSSSSSIFSQESSDDTCESERRFKAQQQKRRYFHSQWKLAIAMKSLVQTVQKSTAPDIKRVEIKNLNDNVVVHHHIHHHYHHVYHHYSDIQEIQAPIKEISPEASDSMERKLTVVPNISQEVATNSVSSSMMRRDSSSLSSLFKYALHTAAGMISEPRSSKPSVKNMTKHVPRPVKIRTIFVATVIILQKYNKTSLWSNRGNYLLSRWNQISKQQCELWIRNSHLLHLVIQLVAFSKK